MLNFIDYDYSRQIQVLYFIENSIHPVTIDEISDYMGISTKTVLIILPVIKNDITELDFDLKRTHDKKYYLKSEVEDKQIFLDEYVLLCGKKSLVFSIIKELFFREKIITTEFCEERYLSQATFSRGKKRITELLATCDLKLPKYLTSGISGNENKIRIFYLNFFYRFYGSLEWPFEKNTKMRFENLVDVEFDKVLNTMRLRNKKKFYYLLYIIKTRVIQGNYVCEEKNFFEHIENYDMYIELMKSYLSLYHITNMEIIKNETDFLISALYTQEIVEIQMNFTKSNSVKSVITKLWVDEVKKQFDQNLTEKEEVLLKKRVSLLHTKYEYGYDQRKIFSKYELCRNTPKQYEKILFEKTKIFYRELMENQTYKEYRKTYLDTVSSNSIIEDYYHYLYCFLYNLKKSRKINIYISDSMGEINKTILEKKLIVVFENRITIKKIIDNTVEIILTADVNKECEIEEFCIASYLEEKKFYKILQRIQWKIYKQL